jgi:DNA polymerase-3 subunit alpha
MAFERETIGFYATGHPLARHRRTLQRLANVAARDLAEAADRAQVVLGGMVVAPRTTVVKSGQNEGRKMAFFQLEDLTGTVECVLFTRAYAEYGPLLEPDRIVFVEGKVDRTRETPSVQVDRIFPVEEGPRALARGVLLRLGAVSPDALARLREVLGPFKGGLPVVLEFRPEPATVARVKAGPGWWVAPNDDLLPTLAGVPDIEAAEFLAREP